MVRVALVLGRIELPPSGVPVRIRVSLGCFQSPPHLLPDLRAGHDKEGIFEARLLHAQVAGGIECAPKAAATSVNTGPLPSTSHDLLVDEGEPWSADAAADTQEAVPSQGNRQGEIDRGLCPLEGPVAAGRLVGDSDADALAVQAVQR